MFGRLRLAVPLALALLALGCVTASGAGGKKVSLGDYQASPSVEPSGIPVNSYQRAL